MQAFRVVTCFLVGVIHAIPPPTLLNIPIRPNQNLTDTRVSFKYLYVVHSGQSFTSKPSEDSITVTATASVSDSAHLKGVKTVARMVINMPDAVFKSLARSLGVGLFTKSEGVTIYPENSGFVDTPECRGRCDGACAKTCTFDGRKYSSLGGLAGNRATVLDDIVLCNSRDPYGRTENILSHEFAHVIMRYAPSAWNLKIRSAYTNARQNRLWTLSHYAMSNAQEYWAEATESWFLDIKRTDVSGGMNTCGTSSLCPSERAARSYIKKRDPKLYACLSYIYTHNRPSLPGNLRTCM